MVTFHRDHRLSDATKRVPPRKKKNCGGCPPPMIIWPFSVVSDLGLPLWGLLKKLGCHEKESALEDSFLSFLLPLIGRRSRRMRELKELRPHPSRPVGTPSPGEAGEGKDRFLSFLAFSTIPLAGMM